MPIQIDFQNLFHCSSGSQVAAFSQAQLHLYRHDVSLQDYFLPLQGKMNGLRFNHGDQRPSKRSFASAPLGANKVSRLLRRKKIKADVLFCPAPYFLRNTETQFLIRALLGLAQTDSTILCLLPLDAPCRDELNARLE